MKRTFTLLTLALLILGNLNTVLAQTWDWANQIAGSENIEVRDLTLDASGNILVYGYFTGNITIGVNSFTNFGASNTRDIYLAKYSSDGTLLWARQYGSDSNEDPFGIVTDESDNIFITGGFRNTASFDSKQIISLGGQDVFLAKISSSGTVDWARSVARGTSGNRGYDIDYQDGYLYITAMVKGTAELGSIGEPGGVVQITQTGGNYNSFAAKFDTSGDFYWATHFPCDDNTLLEAISVDEVGYLYVGGALIGTMTANGTDYTSTGSGDIIILQLNTSDGTVEWVRKGGGIGDDQLRSIKAIDNNIFVIGYVQGTGTIDSTATSQSSSYTAAGSDIFAARYNAEGRLLWKTIIGGPGWDSGYGIQIHENIMVCSGYFSSSVTFNESTITSGGGYDTVFFVFDLDGNPITAGSLSGDLEDRGQGVIYDGLGNTYISGYFASTELKYDDSGSLVSFTPPLSNSSSPSKDGFLAKYNNPFSAVFSHKKDVACNGGSTGELTVTTYFGTAPYTYAWTKDGSPYGSNTPILTNLPAGAYTVTVTDANLKTTQTSHTFTEPDAISDGGASLTHVTCPGGANGEISINPVGGTGNLSYFWTTSNGSGLVNDDQNQTGLMAGNYCLTITDENGCQFTKTYTLTDPDDIIITGSVTNITNPGNNGAVEITNISGGTGSYPADFSYNWVGPNSYSSTNKDVSGLNDEGDYTLTVTDNAGCTQDKTFNVVDEQVFSIWISSTTNVSCNGGNSGSATVSYFKPSGFPENPITYSWTLSSGGDVLSSMETASALLAGTYKVVVTYDDDDNPLTDNEHVIDNIQITQPTAITGSITPTVVSCHNGSDGSAVLTVSGGTPPNSYSWSSGHSSKDIMGQVAGDYSVTVTDNNGCEKLFETTITQPDDITVTIDETPVTCYGGSNGALSITGITGGNGGYSQLWSNTLTSSTISNLTAGYYSVTVTDSKGCQKFQAASVSEPTQISATFDITKPSCYGGADGELTVNASGGTSPYEYSIDGITFQVNSTFTNLIADTYTITIKDKADCTRSYNITVDQPSEISVNHTDNKPTCPESTDGSIGLTVSGGTGAKTYFWTGPGIVLPSVKDQTDLGVGSYSVRVTDENICYIDYPIILESANPTPTPTLDSDATSNTICSGNIITFTAGGGDEYVFYLNGSEIQARSTDNTFVASLLNNQDEVSVIVYSTAGCMAESLPITVTVNPLPEANISYAGSPYCATGTATPTQTGTTGGTYSSTAGLIIDATTGEVNLETSDAGTYTVTYAFSDGTCDNTTTAEIVVNPLPEATISYAGSPYCATGTATPTQTGTTGGTYSSTAGLVIDATTGEVNLETSDAGTYTVTYAFSDGTCDNTTTAEIVVNPLPEVTLATLADVCVDATPFTLTGGLPVGGSYSGNGVMGSSFDPNAAGVGTHTITYTYTDGNGCVNFATQDITVNPLPEATISYAGSPYCATGTATPTQTGTTGGTYSSTAGLVIDATTGEVNLETSDAGTYTVTYAFSDGTCDNTTTAEIAVNPLPTVTAPADFETCSGETITLTASGDATSYTWDNSVVDGVPFVITETTTFTVTGTNTTTGCSATDEVVVTVNPIPEPFISTIDNLAVCAGDDINVVFTSDIQNAQAYQWFKDGAAITGTNLSSYTATESGSYSLEVTESGCSGHSNSLEVVVNPLPIVTAPADFETCSGETITLTASGDATSYTWDNSVVDGVPFVITETTTFTVTGTNTTTGCSATDEVVVTVNPIPEPFISTIDNLAVCAGDDINVVFTSNIQNAQAYQWFKDGAAITGTNLSSYTATESGSYSLEVTESGCSGHSNSLEVVVNPLPIVTAPADFETCSGETITLTASGDATSYTWDNSVVDGVPFVITETTTFTVTGTNTTTGCSATDEVVVTVNPIPEPFISTIDNLAVCAGDDINVVFTSNIQNAQAYQWFKDGAAITGTNLSSYTATESGSYSLEVTESGCSGHSNSLEVVVNPLPIVTAPADFETCSGETITLTASGDATSYTWDNSVVDGVPFVITETTTFTVTGTNTTTGCSATDEVVVTVNPIPVPFISTIDNLAVCAGDDINVVFTSDIQNAQAYQWFKDGAAITGTNLSSYTATESGSYSLEVTESGCSGHSNSLEVVVNPLPIVTAPADFETCSGETITLTASGDATSYTWDNSVVDGVPFVITETTTFTVTGTNTTTGCSATNEVMVTVNPIPEPLISTEDKVEYYLDEDISTVFTVDINDAESYQWFNNGIAIPSADQPNYTATEVGVYSAEVTVNGCSGISNEIEITQISKIGYIDGDNIVCSGNGPVLELIDYSYITIISWEYSISGTIWQSSGDNNPVFYAPPINQTTQYRVKAKNSLGLFIYTDLFTVDVDENTIGGSVTGSTSICQGETSELTLTGHLGDVIKWQLSIDNGTAWIDIENTATTYTSDALTLTTLFRAVVKNGACDEAFSDAATITVYPTPEPTISTINNLNICSGDDINVAFTCDIYNADTYQWFKNGGVINGAVESSYTATELGVYSVKVTVNGCSGLSNDLAIVEIERPAPTISTQDKVEYNFGEIISTTFTVSISDAGSYQWFNNGTAIPSANQSTYTATEIGVYSAVVTVNGCTGTSNPIAITQNQDFNPIITTDDNLEWCEGQDILVNLSVNIANADEYVWFRNDGVIPEASTQNIIVEEDGVYKVKVTVNEFTATSNEIEIVTLPTPKPTISTEDNLTWTEDETISVTFTVDITDADAYQWLNGDEPITDAISTSYEATEVGEYSVLVTKGICTGQSNTLTVTIETIPLYDVTFTVQNTSGDLIENAEIFVDTFDPIVTNEAGVAILSCPEGTYSYQVRLEEYNTSEGEFTVIDQNIDVSVVMVPSGISDEEFLSIKLYPNPFNNEIKISDPELITRAIITSISGQKIMDINLEGTDTINTQKLTPGVYLIRLYTQNSESKIYKMVKNR